MFNWNDNVSKYLKYSIIGLVVGSFAFLGIYEVLTTSQSYIASIDGVKITQQEFSQYSNARRSEIMSGATANKEVYTQASNFVESKQFFSMVLNEMVNRVVIHKFLTENGIKVTHKTVAIHIKSLPFFQKDGKFSPEYMSQYLKYINTSEYDFINNQVPQVEQAIFEQVISATKLQSTTFASKYAIAQKKIRNIETLTIIPNSTVQISETALKKLYDQQKKNFVQKPQHFVSISYIDDYIKDNVNVFSASSQELLSYYNDSFAGSIVDFYLADFGDMKSAITAQSIVKKQGISLNSVVDAMKKQGVKVNGVDTNSEKIENKAILHTILNRTAGGVTDIISDGKKHFVVQVLKVSEPTRFTESGTQAQELAMQRKCSNVNIYIEKIKQELNSGASFEAVALKYGFPLSTQMRIDAQTGLAFDVNTNLPVQIDDKFRDGIINNSDTQYGNIVMIDAKTCSYAVYQQNRIEPLRTKTLDEVRGQVISMYVENQKLEELHNSAKRIVGQVQSTKSHLDSYSTHGIIERKSISVGDGHADIFNHKIGDVFYYISGEGDQKIGVIVRVNSDTKFTGQIDENDVVASRNNTQDLYYSAFAREFLGELRREFRVKIRGDS